jgi:hypothetical protein
METYSGLWYSGLLLQCIYGCYSSLFSPTAVPLNMVLKSEAAVKASVRQVLNLYKAGKYLEARTMSRRLPGKASEKCVKKMPTKVKKVYLKKVKSMQKTWTGVNKPYMWNYYLTDVNKDRTAELLIQYGSCEADMRILVYTYKMGRAVKVGTVRESHVTVYAYPKANGFIVRSTHMGVESIRLVTMKKSKIRTKRIGLRQIPAEEFDKYQYMDLPYELEGHVHYTSSYKPYFDYKEFK